jgi:hypothetical protein
MNKSNLNRVSMLILLTVLYVFPAFAKPGGNGWQAVGTLNVATGTVDQFVQQTCPSGYSVENGVLIAANGPTTENGFNITGSSPLLIGNPAPDYSTWGWNVVWYSGGAPAGSQLVYNINCKKGAP